MPRKGRSPVERTVPLSPLLRDHARRLAPISPGKTERKVFTELTGPHAGELNDALGRIGFRRSQNVAYRPSCLDCAACVSVRVVAGEFQPSATPAPDAQAQRRSRGHRLQAVGDRGAICAAAPLSAAPAIPSGGMVEMDEQRFLPTWSSRRPVKTYIIEYREPSVGRPARAAGRRLPDRPAGGRPVDDLQLLRARRSRAARASAPTSSSTISSAPGGRACPTSISAIGSRSSRRMAYKARFRPLERLGPGGWHRFDPEQRELPLR